MWWSFGHRRFRLFARLGLSFRLFGELVSQDRKRLDGELTDVRCDAISSTTDRVVRVDQRSLILVVVVDCGDDGPVHENPLANQLGDVLVLAHCLFLLY